MKRSLYHIIVSVSLLVAVCLTGCNSEEWEAMPTDIRKFVAQYYPGAVVESYRSDASGYYVDIKDGASLVFTTPQAWQSVNGNGTTLPAVFIENEMPPALERYLVEMETVDGVYVATRDARVYRLKMFDSEITYNISTEKVSYTK